jgi:hypothetical protein
MRIFNIAWKREQLLAILRGSMSLVTDHETIRGLPWNCHSLSASVAECWMVSSDPDPAEQFFRLIRRHTFALCRGYAWIYASLHAFVEQFEHCTGPALSKLAAIAKSRTGKD